jgi:hypothetical protein
MIEIDDSSLHLALQSQNFFRNDSMRMILGVIATEAVAGAVRRAPISPAFGRQADPTAPTPPRAQTESETNNEDTISQILVAAQKRPKGLGQVPVGLTVSPAVLSQDEAARATQTTVCRAASRSVQPR